METSGAVDVAKPMSRMTYLVNPEAGDSKTKASELYDLEEKRCVWMTGLETWNNENEIRKQIEAHVGADCNIELVWFDQDPINGVSLGKSLIVFTDAAMAQKCVRLIDGKRLFGNDQSAVKCAFLGESKFGRMQDHLNLRPEKKSRPRSRERSPDRDRRKKKSRSREREKDKARDKDRDKDKDRGRDKERGKDKDRERDRDRDRDRDRSDRGKSSSSSSKKSSSSRDRRRR